jgi:aldose 1-epimerase
MDDQVLIQTQLVFTPGTPWYQAFPHKHTLKVDVSVRNDSVRWTYTVDNKMGDRDVPFGFALHPWFLYQGDRADTFLTIPASHLMESKELLPTGRLVVLDGTQYDARKPLSLANFVIDDVYYGLRSQAPVVIDFKDPGVEIGLFATADFTHLVVYTPDQEPYFCVENQTCSTDAHNLHTQGKEREAHLLIAETGNQMSGWVEYRFKNY